MQKTPEIKISKALVLSALCLSFLSLSCTAYLNTYYNGESAFKEGFAEHRKVLRNFPDSLVVTPSQTVAAKYDRAIEKSTKVLDVFTRKKKWHDDAVFLMGKSYYYKKDIEKSIKRFKELQQVYPESPHIPESFLYLCKAYIEEDNLDKAEETVTIILQKYPWLDKDQQVSRLLIDTAIRRGSRSQAIALLEKALRSAKSETARIDLILRVSELYIDLKQYSKAIVLLEKTPRKKDLPEQSYRMDRALVRCYVGIDSLTKALNYVNLMLKKRQYSHHFDEILLSKGMILSRMGRFDDAIAVLKSIIGDLDSTNIANDTSSVVSQALYELGLIYQKKKGDYNNAAEFFKLASKSRDKSASSFSAARLSAIEMLRELRKRKTEPKDTCCETDFKIGELFRYELDEPDSAFRQFLSLYNDSSAGPFAPKALCVAAFVARDDMRDSLLADSLFRAVITGFPSTDFARIAQEELNLPVTVRTRQDSAREAFRVAEDLFFKNQDEKAAIQAFFNVYKKYSDLPIAPRALYVAAYLSDEVLQKNVTAKSLYERICREYPQSIYCTEKAQPRIKIADSTMAALGLKVEDPQQQESEVEETKDDEKDKKDVRADSLKADEGTPKEGSDVLFQEGKDKEAGLKEMEKDQSSEAEDPPVRAPDDPVSAPETENPADTSGEKSGK